MAVNMKPDEALGLDVDRANPIVINEVLVLNNATLLKSQSIVIGEKAKIFTNAFLLSMEAQEISIAGKPQILVFQGKGESLDGRNAGTIMIQASNLTGDGVLHIDNRGEDAKEGRAGDKGAKGSRGGQGTQRDWNLINGCHGGSNGGTGGVGGRGGDGGRGGNGGQGGDVILSIGKGLLRTAGDKRIEISAPGGKSGSGGRPGPGGDGGDGGEGAPGTTLCGGTGPGAPGPVGPSGNAGPAGAPGNAGKVYVLGASPEEATAFFT